jgi:hypothetical protein
MRGDLPWNGFIAKYRNLCNEIVCKDERLWLQAQWYRNNQSSLLRILFENDKRQIKWLQDNLQQHRSSNFGVIAAASY